jgi:hypothetical protein
MIQVHLFKAKEKNNEGRFKAWWPKEGEGKIPMFGGQWKEKEKVIFHLFPLPPPSNFVETFVFFPLILKFYFTMVLGGYLCISSLFFGL